MDQPIFIVSSGRCGSTMLTKQLSKIKEMLLISEFFIMLPTEALKEREMNSADFWKLITTPNLQTKLIIQNGINVPEYIVQNKENTSPLLITALPFIADEPNELYSELKEYILSLETCNASGYYKLLFSWLCKKFDKKIWIERSGDSISFIKELIELFPNAKFIHLYRNGMDCALSMSKHNAYKLALIQNLISEKLATNASNKSRNELGELAYLLPDNFNLQVFNDYVLPVDLYGKLWSARMLKGVIALGRIPKEQVLQICYERILQNPEHELSRLVSFILPVEYDKLSKSFINCAEEIKSNSQGRWKELPESTFQKLFESCRIGHGILHDDLLNTVINSSQYHKT